MMKPYQPRLLLIFLLSLCLFLPSCQAKPTTSITVTPSASTTAPPAETTTPVVTTSQLTKPPDTITAEPSPTPEETTSISAEYELTFQSHFGFMPALWDYENARAAGAGYDRPFFELFRWDMIEKEPGVFDFYETDKHVKEAQSYGLHIIANIQPFAYWDQEKNHPGERDCKYKPSDITAYRNFVTSLVERYDGDDAGDMPGLTVPIKHWELMNEPEFQTDIVYFQGTGADYAEVLKNTYEAIKQADPESFMVQGGMAGMMTVCTDFWQDVFDAGGGAYLDIMNMHSIGHGEHLNIPAFKSFLLKNGLQDKPVWVTEVQFQQSFQTQNYTNADFARMLARSYIYALANGVDKLFYVNIRMPPFYDAGIPFDERSALITDDGEQSALFRSHSTVSDMLGGLAVGDSVEVIRETVSGWYVTEGQYKFTIGGKVIYALWGNGALPSGISGMVRVVDISGAETAADAATLRLSNSPVFIIPE